jgi:hypothetical protein
LKYVCAWGERVVIVRLWAPMPSKSRGVPNAPYAGSVGGLTNRAQPLSDKSITKDVVVRPIAK